MSSRITLVVKALLVGALLTYVFVTIQWRDAITMTSPAGDESTVPGTIVGAWDGSEIRFQAQSSTLSGPRTLRPGRQADGSRIDVVPGIFTYFRNLDFGWFALGAACFAVVVVFSGIRWWWLLRVNELGIGVLEAQRYTWIGLFFNNVVPGATGGDLVKAIYIVRRSPAKRLEAGLSVVVDRLLGLLSLTLLGALVVLFFIDRFRVLAASIWLLIAAAALFGVLFFSRRVRRSLKLDRLLKMLPDRAQEFLARIDQAVFLYRGHKKGIGLWVLGGMLSHSLAVLTVVCIARGLNAGLPDAEYFVLVPVINIVSALPIAPNGWGVGEALYANLFAQYGAVYLSDVGDAERIMRTRGVAVSLLFRVLTTMMSLVGGLLVLLGRERLPGRGEPAAPERP
ncbi:MAG: flippase-like domain-containing protein [Gammaproteobacteria bacterium]|nr:flippase-like domain-containing protein [Gammaproteobacteria bacterium]